MQRYIFFMLFCLLLQAATPLLLVPDTAVPQIRWKGHFLKQQNSKMIPTTAPTDCKLQRGRWIYPLRCDRQNNDLIFSTNEQLFDAIRAELKSSPAEDPYLVSDFFASANDNTIQVYLAEINHKPSIDILNKWQDQDGMSYCLFLTTDSDLDHIQAELTTGPETLIFNSASPMPQASEQVLKHLNLDHVPLPKKGLIGAVRIKSPQDKCELMVQDGILQSKSSAQMAKSKQQILNAIVDYLKIALKHHK